MAENFAVGIKETATGEPVAVVVAFGKGFAIGVVKDDRAGQGAILEIGRAGESPVGVETSVGPAFLAGKIGGLCASLAIRIKFAGHPLQTIVLPVFLQEELSLLVPVARHALFFPLHIGSLGFFGAGREVFNAEAVEFAVFPVGGVARLAIGPPTGGGAVKFIPDVVKVVGNGSVGVKKGGGSLAFAVEKGIGCPGFSVFAEEDLGPSHLAVDHAGFGLQFSVEGIELPISLGQAFEDSAFGDLLAFEIKIDPAAVPAVGSAELPANDLAVGAVEEEFDGVGLGLAGADGQLSLKIAVRALFQDKEGDEGGFIVLPDGIAGGLVGAVGELVGAVDILANGLSGLEPLEDGIQDEADF